MFKATTTEQNKNVPQTKKQVVRHTEKRRYHALGMCRDDAYRDPSTLTFARMGLLASRW